MYVCVMSCMYMPIFFYFVSFFLRRDGRPPPPSKNAATTRPPFSLPTRAQSNPATVCRKTTALDLNSDGQAPPQRSRRRGRKGARRRDAGRRRRRRRRRRRKRRRRMPPRIPQVMILRTRRSTRTRWGPGSRCLSLRTLLRTVRRGSLLRGTKPRL